MLYRTALGIVIKDLRIKQGWTLRELSTKALMSLGYISEIERGVKEVSSDLMFSLCEALDSNVPDVLDRVSTLMRESVTV
jgi:transcriptional regulator with XRE-family HTH domain